MPASQLGQSVYEFQQSAPSFRGAFMSGIRRLAAYVCVELQASASVGCCTPAVSAPAGPAIVPDTSAPAGRCPPMEDLMSASRVVMAALAAVALLAAGC